VKFNNRPNPVYYHSRSIAVLAIPLIKKLSRVYVPLARRSERMELYRGLLGLPCGYLDWDESASEAMTREVWEELGLDITRLGEPILGSTSQPYFVFSNPNKDEKQNVTLRFRFCFEVDDLPTLRGSEESHDVQWVELGEAISLDLAFNHSEILKECGFSLDLGHFQLNPSGDRIQADDG
jgi:8-oxo-dGTP pyrophosphatase MutT (NUDIX family)